MKISENDLLIHYDEKEEKLVVYRLLAEEVPSAQKILNTEYDLSKLKIKGIRKAASLLGEDILVSLAGTRKALINGKE
jgi:hypothetical protein